MLHAAMQCNLDWRTTKQQSEYSILIRNILNMIYNVLYGMLSRNGQHKIIRLI